MNRHNQRWFLALLVPALLFIAAGILPFLQAPVNQPGAAMSPQDIARLRVKLDQAGLQPREARFWKPL